MAELKVNVNILNLDNVIKACIIANNAIYEKSNYTLTLRQICMLLCPMLKEEDIGVKHIECAECELNDCE